MEDEFGLKFARAKNPGVDFPDGPVVKNLSASAGDMGLILGLGRFHMPWGN